MRGGGDERRLAKQFCDLHIVDTESQELVCVLLSSYLEMLCDAWAEWENVSSATSGGGEEDSLLRFLVISNGL
jgi:hypothetical protein